MVLFREHLRVYSSNFHVNMLLLVNEFNKDLKIKQKRVNFCIYYITNLRRYINSLNKDVSDIQNITDILIDMKGEDYQIEENIRTKFHAYLYSIVTKIDTQVHEN